MGVSESGDEGGTGVDCTVGTIVWVRRRNGSWWPGRILGPEELSASHLMSPRSGTPVKLLGREDASVDWYNLEKSKRVKPFRCGEFDACIERAEASQGAPIKKREKYARREDAILHALELEKGQLEVKGQKSGNISNFTTNKVLAAQKKASDFSSSNVFVKNDESSKSDIQKSQTISRKATLLHENIKNSKYSHDDKNSQLIGREEDVPGAIPRTRGLQDFGLRIAPKKKPPPSVIWETSTKNSDSSIDMFPKMGGDEQFNLGRSSMNIKRKRSGGLSEESLVKKRDRRRPLVQVLQSSAKLQNSNSLFLDHDSHDIQEEEDNIDLIHRAKRSRYLFSTSDSLHHGGYSFENDPNMTSKFLDGHIDGHDPLSEGNMTSGMIKADESDSSETDYLQSDTEELEEEEVREETRVLGDSGRPNTSGSLSYGPLASRVTENIRDVNSSETPPLSSYTPEMHEHFSVAGQIGVSKWHIKGKRNVRNLIKRPSDTVDGKGCISVSEKCNGSVWDMPYGMKRSDFRKREMEPSSQQTVGRDFYHNKKDVNFPTSRADLADEGYDQEEMTGYGSQRYPTVLKSSRDRPRSRSYNDSEDDSHVKSRPGWEVDGGYQDARSSYWNDYNDPMFPAHLSKGLRSSLVDVELKVQASYQGEHVPLVSLMSRLNGKAIIGHPVQVEILEDGSTDQYFSSSHTGIDEGAGSQPVWTTARRTAMHRVPRSNPMTSMEDEDAGVSHFQERDLKPPVKKSSGQFNHQAKSSKKSHSKRSSGKSHKKSAKKISLSSQKTRALSSFSTDQKFGGQNGDAKLGRSAGVLGGLIKSEGVMPLVTCVPVKVAFSRILEAVGRPSAAAAHRVRMSSPAVRDPS